MRVVIALGVGGQINVRTRAAGLVSVLVLWGEGAAAKVNTS